MTDNQIDTVVELRFTIDEYNSAVWTIRTVAPDEWVSGTGTSSLDYLPELPGAGTDWEPIVSFLIHSGASAAVSYGSWVLAGKACAAMGGANPGCLGAGAFALGMTIGTVVHATIANVRDEEVTPLVLNWVYGSGLKAGVGAVSRSATGSGLGWTVIRDGFPGIRKVIDRFNAIE